MTDPTLVNPPVDPGSGEPTPVVAGPSAATGAVPEGYSTYTGAPYDANPVKLPEPAAAEPKAEEPAV